MSPQIGDITDKRVVILIIAAIKDLSGKSAVCFPGKASVLSGRCNFFFSTFGSFGPRRAPRPTVHNAARRKEVGMGVVNAS